MREIKFRAWDKRNKVMYQVVTINFRTEPVTYGLGYRENPYLGVKYPPDIEVMQFTGLKDKNGKEIYDADILKCNGGAEDFLMAVEWDNRQAAWTAKVPWDTEDYSNPELKWYINMNFCTTEVIGNIYENPELLK